MEIQIRAMRPDDFDAVQEIFRTVHAMHQENRPDLYRKLDAPLSRAYYTQMVENPGGIALCAECGGKVAGVAYTYMKAPTENPVMVPRITAFMDDLAVHPDFRGQHIGAQLMQAVLGYAWRCDNIETVVSLITSDNEASIHLHEKLGFSYCGQIRNAGVKFGKRLHLNIYELTFI